MAVAPAGRVRISWPPGLGAVTRQMGRAAAVAIAAGLIGGFVAGLLARIFDEMHQPFHHKCVGDRIAVDPYFTDQVLEHFA